MIFFYEALFLVSMCLLVYCVLSVITTPESQILHLPKMLWLILVIVMPLAGGIAWLAAGRTRRPVSPTPYRGNAGVPPEYDRPGRAAAGNPDDDAEFLASLKRRAEEQRKRAAEQARGEDETP